MTVKIKNLLNTRVSVIVVVVLVFLLLMGFTSYVAELDKRNQQSHLQDRVSSRVSELRTRIELEVNTTLNLTMGSVVYVSFNPDINQEEFIRFARAIKDKASYIKNIGLARDNIITHVYPLEGNEKALGLRYADNPSQWAAVARAIEHQDTVLAGPVNLIQGGQGFISRIPVFLGDENRTYWGITSIVILVDEFFRKIGFDEYLQDLDIAIRGKDAKGMEGDIFYGNPALFADPEDVLMKISLPIGSWVIAAAPKGGWVVNNDRIFLIYTTGFIVALIFSWLLSLLLIKNIHLEEEKRVSEMAIDHKNRFFSYMAHELRTPLTAIYGAIRILDSDVIPISSDKWKQLTVNAHRNCQRLQWIVNDILDMRKLESGKIEYQLSDTEMLPIINASIDAMIEYSRQFNIDLSISCVPQKPLSVHADKVRLQQVVVNLLSNAIKHSPENDRVEIFLKETDRNVRVEVHDNGKGIDPQKLTEIFKEFSQSNEAGENPTKIVASTGLGLTISKRIIDDHDGVIGCYNKPDYGAVFYLELPMINIPNKVANLQSA